jgi:hypothetical protein
LRVLLDDKIVPDALLDVDRPVDPGSHKVTASAPGYASVTRFARVHERDHATVEIVLAAALGATAGSVSADVGPLARRTSADSRSGVAWGWIAIGTGAAGLGVSIVTGVIALDKKSSLDSKCRPGCPASAASEIDSFRSNRTVSYLMLAVGAASLGVGSYVLLAGRTGAPSVTATILPAMAAIRGTF